MWTRRDRSRPEKKEVKRRKMTKSSYSVPIELTFIDHLLGGRIPDGLNVQRISFILMALSIGTLGVILYCELGLGQNRNTRRNVLECIKIQQATE
jgi:hypothetical protein